jgi:hypothetical protein
MIGYSPWLSSAFLLYLISIPFDFKRPSRASFTDNIENSVRRLSRVRKTLYAYHATNTFCPFYNLMCTLGLLIYNANSYTLTVDPLFTLFINHYLCCPRDAAQHVSVKHSVCFVFQKPHCEILNSYSRWKYFYTYVNLCRSQRPRGLRRRSAVVRLLRLWVWIPPGAWMSVCCVCWVLTGRGLCDELITRPEEPYRLWCDVMCDLETSWMWRPWPTGGL